MVDGKIQAFPWNHWEHEFERAKDCGLNCIDWIVEAENIDNNPLFNDNGLKRMKELEKRTGIQIISVCADYFMENPLIRCSKEELKLRTACLDRLLKRMYLAGIPYLEFPCVDNASIRSEKEMGQLIAALRSFFNKVQNLGITFAFETSLDPRAFCTFLDICQHPAAKINYDSGNSASLGYDIRDEFNSYGQNIVTMHVKDRLLNGTTVSLGTGNTDFDALFEMLHEVDYTGPIILQGARGDDDMAVVREGLAFVQTYLKRQSV